MKRFGRNQKRRIRQEVEALRKCLQIQYALTRDFMTSAEYYRDLPAIERLRSMTEETRLEVFREFCAHCGTEDPNCRCWDDS